MFVSKYASSSNQMFAAFAVGIAVIATGFVTPAWANSSASADIAAPLRAAQTVTQPPLGTGDTEFRQLFTSWRSLDQGGAGVGRGTSIGIGSGTMIAHGATGSIPSLMPIQSPRFTSGFGMRWHPVLGGRRPHEGIDLAGPVGTPVRATGDGVVGRADWFGSYGLFVELEHGSQLETRYGHMSRLNVAAGQAVHRGDIIGYIGTTGRTTGPHLHYEVRVNGVAVNPLPYMQGGVELARAAAADPGANDANAAAAGDE